LHVDNNRTGNPDTSVDPFAQMGLVRFWIISALFWVSFPASVLVCLVILGPVQTKQLARALMRDFLQTLAVIAVIAGLAVWAGWEFLSRLL